MYKLPKTIQAFTDYASEHKASGRTVYTQLKDIISKERNLNSKILLKNAKWSEIFIKKISENPNTLATRIRDLRKIYTAILPDKENEINEIIKPFKKDIKAKQRQEKKSNLANLKSRFMINEDTVFKLVNILNSSSSWLDKALLLILATGRRSIEILRITQMPNLGIKPEHIIINGVAKQGTKKKKPFEVPLLFITYPEMVDAWRDVRKAMREYAELDNRQIANKITGSLNRRLKSILTSRDNTKKISSHLLRKIYGAQASRTHKPISMEPSLYIGQILGHQAGEFNTTSHYRNMKIFKNNLNTQEESITINEDSQEIKPRSGIYERLFNTVREMKNNGERINMRSVKAKGFGSDTLQRHLRDIKEQLEI